MPKPTASCLLALLPALLLAGPLNGQVVYVDGANPASADTNPGTEAEPFRTISGAMAVHAGPGVTIRVKPAVYALLEVKKSGTPAAPFVFEATAPGAEVQGAYLSGRSWVVLDGFTIRGQVRFGGSVGVVLSNNEIDARTTNKAIYATACDGLKIVANRIWGSTYDGIVFRDTGRCLIEGNEIHGNANKGVVLNTLNGGSWENLIRRNRFHSNGASAICLDIWAHDNLTMHNLMWDNQHGIEHHGSFRNRHLGEVIWGNRNDGIWIKDHVTELTIANCIVAENGTGNSSSFNVYVDSLSAPPETNDNVYWFSSGQPSFRRGQRSYASLAEWTAETGKDARSFEANPRFRDPANHDFRLTQLSPAIDAANTSVDGWVAEDAEGVAPLDDPRIVDRGVGPIAYADRGAYEFVPSTLDVDPSPAALAAGIRTTPNPLRAGGRIDYVIPRAARVKLRVLDLQGRRVATLVDAHLPAGAHTVRWEGAPSAAPGVYVAVLETAGARSAHRFALVR